MSRGRVVLVLVIAAFAIWGLRAAAPRAQRSAGGAVDAHPQAEREVPDPPEVALGERLFLETRFARFFFAESRGDVNAVLTRGDPALDRAVTPEGSMPGRFAGGAMNCRACHLVEEHAAPDRGGSRNYADFAPRSPVPARAGTDTATTRNTPALVDATLPRRGFLLHEDGEFASTAVLVRETWLGRNFGWLPEERGVALAHVARVIRGDDGRGVLARARGGAYRVLLRGTDPAIAPELRLPEAFRLEVERATDVTVVETAARLVAAYVESLALDHDSLGTHRGSPYDTFLAKNGLPRTPAPHEADSLYGRRLLREIERLKSPRFVAASEDTLRLHPQSFTFGPLELRGLLVFLSESAGTPRARGATGRTSTGNCVSCHPAPHFTDFGFHNTGVAEAEYDAVHGAGAFARLEVPGLEERNAEFDRWLPATSRHPRALGMLRSIPRPDDPARADLGLWNVFANPDLPEPQAAIRTALAADSEYVAPAALLERSLARFKTRSLRDLGHSDPYFHTGRARRLEDVLSHYVELSVRSRAGLVRNGDSRLPGIVIAAEDVPAVAAFLRSLNQDYE